MMGFPPWVQEDLSWHERLRRRVARLPWRAFCWSVLTRHRLRRRYHLWLGGGADMTWAPPPLIGPSFPKWAPLPLRDLSWRLYYIWLDHVDRKWRRELRRTYRRQEGLPDD
jgi:hypothetical protein